LPSGAVIDSPSHFERKNGVFPKGKTPFPLEELVDWSAGSISRGRTASRLVRCRFEAFTTDSHVTAQAYHGITGTEERGSNCEAHKKEDRFHRGMTTQPAPFAQVILPRSRVEIPFFAILSIRSQLDSSLC
jgi:hypothetical protein